VILLESDSLEYLTHGTVKPMSSIGASYRQP